MKPFKRRPNRKKRRNLREGVDARRKGHTAIDGGTHRNILKEQKELFTYRILTVPKSERAKYVFPVGTIADIYGNNAPAGEMTQIRIEKAAARKSQIEISRGK